MIPQNEESEENHIPILPRKDKHPTGGGYLSHNRNIYIFLNKSTGEKITDFINKKERKTCVIQRKWVSLRSKGKQEGS